MSWAPFTVDSNGNVRNLQMELPADRLTQRMQALRLLETGFIEENRGQSAVEHAKVLQKTLDLMTSNQMSAFRNEAEPEAIKQRYGDNNFGRSCMMARRLVEAGVPFVEVNLGGWDNHQNIFPTLQNQRLPMMDQGMSALIADLVERGMWEDTAVIWMGEFGRTPESTATPAVTTGLDPGVSWSVAVA